MPDQFTLAALQRHELAPSDRSPVMAEIDLVSSHGPWVPLPRLVDWKAVGERHPFWRPSTAARRTPIASGTAWSSGQLSKTVTESLCTNGFMCVRYSA